MVGGFIKIRITATPVAVTGWGLAKLAREKKRKGRRGREEENEKATPSSLPHYKIHDEQTTEGGLDGRQAISVVDGRPTVGQTTVWGPGLSNRRRVSCDESGRIRCMLCPSLAVDFPRSVRGALATTNTTVAHPI